MESEAIYSVTALTEMADMLEREAAKFRARAARLSAARNHRPFGKYDRPALVRAGQYLQNLPEFPAVPATIWPKIAARFLVDNGEFDRYARSLCARERRRIADDKARAARAMHAKGIRGIDISRAVGLSPARVSAIVRADPDAAKAKRAGLSLNTYRRAKASGTLKTQFL